MSATLYRSGSNWIIRALAWHVFDSAKKARDWAKANQLRLIRCSQEDRP